MYVLMYKAGWISLCAIPLMYKVLSVQAFFRSTECVYRHSAALLNAYRHSAALLSAYRHSVAVLSAYRHSVAVLSAYRHSVAVLSVQASCCCTKCGHSAGVQCVGILLVYNVWAFCWCTMCGHSAALLSV